MYHIKITDEDTGDVKLDADVVFCAGAYKGNFARYVTFTYSESEEKVEVKSIIEGLLKEAMFLTGNYL